MLSQVLETPSTVLNQQVHDLLLIIILSNMHGRLLLLVLMVDIGPADLDQELSRLVLSRASRVVEWRLPIVINGVRARMVVRDQTP